ncbi:unnamed protein product [Bursaphelenchus okinawaensis]|uniref:Paired domain-containing protein n=1 Tax=Bursaphelenchus okinawaensis TaxID=465554 RepID=A0A811KD79_9BILA|nr:unnamed protein product [Bursaphelenchus okinawaensis]CAG9100885.1 unnamed protein product [Bursaphelenchus okinawaensis]
MPNMSGAIIKLHKEGRRQCDIAKLLNIAKSTVSHVVRRYVELGHDGDRPRSGRPATVNTRANRQWTKKRFMRNPRTPVRKMARQAGLKETSLCRIVRKSLKMKPYKLKKVQKLTDENKKVRFKRSKTPIHRAANGNWERIFFTDEKIFTLEQAHKPSK